MVKTASKATPATATIDLQALQSVRQTDDVVEYALQCITALQPGLDAAITAAADKQVREVFGGDRVYIGKRPDTGKSARNDQIRRDFQAGERIDLLERKYGLRRVQLWRIINHG